MNETIKHPIDIRGLSKRFKIKETKVYHESYTTSWLSRLLRKHIIRDEILAVNDVSFKIEKSELFGLLGPNGAGKTTLIKMLCTLLWPSEGTAKINGYNIKKYPRQVRASTGTVLDIEMGWYGRLSCRQNLFFYAQINGIPPSQVGRKVSEVLHTVGLADRADERYQKLSSGMRRKLDIARALLSDPPVLLLDEPTIGMDPQSSRDLRQFIKQRLCKEQKRTILLTTHNMNEAEEICDRVAIMHKGKIMAIDKPKEIKRLVKPESRIIAIAGKISSRVVSRVAKLEEITSLTIKQDSTFPNSLRIEACVKDLAISSEISKIITESGGLLYSITFMEPTLEEALIKLTTEESP